MIRDQKDLNDFTARMLAGKNKAALDRASSTAPPKPKKGKGDGTIPQQIKAAGNVSPVAKLPAPATKKSTNAKGGKPTDATRHSITINIK